MALVTFTSDFGTRDYYVGAVKGVILRGAPDSNIIDLSHDIAAQDVAAAAFFLRHAASEFPPGTIHLAIVDPGVGSSRLPLVVRGHGSVWVGPDNGLLSYALEDPQCAAWEIRACGDGEMSPTFHGRDLFAPAAALLAAGHSPDEVGGSPVAHPQRLPAAAARHVHDRLEGEVIHVDGYGNLVTSISRADLEALGAAPRIRLGSRLLHGLATTYADADEGQLLALIGSAGLLEISLNAGSAAAALDSGRGDAVVVEKT